LQAYFKAYFFLRLIAKKMISNRIVDSLILMGFVFSLSSSFQVIQIISGIILLLKMEKIIFNKFRNRFSLKKVLSTSLIILSLFSILFLGIANKIGVENAKLLTKETELRSIIFEKVSVRQSTAYVSFIIGFQNYVENVSFAERAFLGQIENLSNRFVILLGRKPDKPEVWSINRLNYLKIFHQNDGPRTGTSPGLLASYFYIPFFPLNFVLLSLYVVYVLRLLSLNIKHPFSVIGLLLVYFYMLGFFDSPVELINVIGPNFFYVIFVILGLKSSFYK
jgi:hypothetical protein